MLKTVSGGMFRHWGEHLAEATCLDNSQGSISQDSPAQSSPLHNVVEDKVPIVHAKNMLGKVVCVLLDSGKGKPLHGTVFAQGPGCTWWVMQKEGDVQCVPQRNLMLGECSQ